MKEASDHVYVSTYFFSVKPKFRKPLIILNKFSPFIMKLITVPILDDCTSCLIFAVKCP